MRLFALVFLVGCGSASSIDNSSLSAQADDALEAELKKVRITLTPDEPFVAPGGQIQLFASVTGTSDKSVTWQCDYGSIDQTGLFTAPEKLGSYDVRATSSKGKVATISVTVTNEVPEAVSTKGTDSSIDLTALPTTCHRNGQSLMRVSMRVDRYLGTQNGRNGVHELVQGTITEYMYNEAPEVIDTDRAQVAMNISTDVNTEGLPEEIPLNKGDVLEIQGVYIPDASTTTLDVAVLHFTHAPCGYVMINGTKYE